MGSGAGSLGMGNISVSDGSTLEVDYDIQTPGALTLAGSNGVMILHQDCQFGAVTINGVTLSPGTYTYNNLLSQFPDNFAPGGSGSITVPAVPSVLVSPPPPPPPAVPGYYVDYVGGSDSNVGTNPASAWQHCPGDPAATGTAASTSLNPGDTVFFKGGVQYVLTGNGNPVYQTGIGLNWSGAAGQPITYDGNSAGTWGTGRAILTDNYSTKYIAAFYNGGSVNNLAFNNLEIGPIGGAASLPPDPGTGVPSNQGYGIFAYGTMNNVTIQNCYFHDLGYWFNQQPMDGNSLGGSDSRISGGGVIFFGASSVVITNCEFTKQHTAIEFAYSTNSSNLTIASCLFHDYIVWGIDLAGVSGNLDYTYIHDNTFQDMGWAYSPAYWTGYNYSPESCTSCYAGSPHQDPIFHRTGNANVTNGSHIDIYNNTFDETHPYEVYTACIYLEYAPSANVYNNLFNIPNAGIPNGAVPSDPDGAGAPPITISYELNQPSTLRVLNNTFIINTTANAQNAAISWGACGCLKPSSVWPANGTLQVENNLAYSFYTGGDDATLLLLGVVTNQYPVAQWTVDYNDWHSQGTANTWFWWNNQPGFNIQGGLAAAQSVGFEAHGITSNPQFMSLAFSSSTNSVNNDYHLQSGSPAIGAGVNLSSLNLPGLNTDKDGNPRPPPARGPSALTSSRTGLLLRSVQPGGFRCRASACFFGHSSIESAHAFRNRQTLHRWHADREHGGHYPPRPPRPARGRSHCRRGHPPHGHPARPPRPEEAVCQLPRVQRGPADTGTAAGTPAGPPDRPCLRCGYANPLRPGTAPHSGRHRRRDRRRGRSRSLRRHRRAGGERAWRPVSIFWFSSAQIRAAPHRPHPSRSPALYAGLLRIPVSPVEKPRGHAGRAGKPRRGRRPRVD